MPIKEAAILPAEYIKNVIDDEVHRIDDIQRDKRKVELLLRSLARNEATTVSNRILQRNIKEIDDEDIGVNTVAIYLDIFNRLFITDSKFNSFGSTISVNLLFNYFNIVIEWKIKNML